MLYSRRDLAGLAALAPALGLAASTPRPTRTRTVLRFLERATYGPRPGDLERALDLGLEACLEEQFALASLGGVNSPAGNDSTDALVASLATYHLSPRDLLLQDDLGIVTHEFFLAAESRAAFSQRQLYETMVEFWSDHFYIFMRLHSLLVYLKVIDDREVIRPHALGKFRDLLFASAHSPAMLGYLSNVLNGKNLPNENYARELLELHTLGVDSGYTQDDVQQMARVLTGWSSQLIDRGSDTYGQYFFDHRMHDYGRKRLLRMDLPEGRGPDELLAVLEVLATHPHTARNVARKLVRRFVADEPPSELVTRVARTFIDTDGDIKSMLRCIFRSEEFAGAPAKLKRPTKFAISAVRALGCGVDRGLLDFVLSWLMPLGQPPFQWRLPNGYPDVAAPWLSTLHMRWNFALALLDGRLASVNEAVARLVDAQRSSLAGLITSLLHRELSHESHAALADYLADPATRGADGMQGWRDVIAVLLASASFQWM